MKHLVSAANRLVVFENNVTPTLNHTINITEYEQRHMWDKNVFLSWQLLEDFSMVIDMAKFIHSVLAE